MWIITDKDSLVNADVLAAIKVEQRPDGWAIVGYPLEAHGFMILASELGEGRAQSAHRRLKSALDAKKFL